MYPTGQKKKRPQHEPIRTGLAKEEEGQSDDQQPLDHLMALGETVGVEDDDRNCLDENDGREGFGSSLPDVVEGGREWKRMKTGRTNCASGSPNQLQATMPSESIKIPEMKRPAEALDESRGTHGRTSSYESRGASESSGSDESRRQSGGVGCYES